jgi:hypothetical protein
MGMDEIPRKYKTLAQVVEYLTRGADDFELVHHEVISDCTDPWDKTLWVVKNNVIGCYLLYDPEPDWPAWGYRAYAESSDPCMHNAPLRMLDAVPAVSASWRRRVRRYHR